mmetsp:Transcript_16624/g.47345  ORF Transcript_16624/g.47345 Transcript_16624/m.47345 type:complete len:358 (+) Transcript_16624:194-1267(+)
MSGRLLFDSTMGGPLSSSSSSASAAAAQPQPQPQSTARIYPASSNQIGTRVWMVSAKKKEDRKEAWVKAKVYKREVASSGAARVFLKEEVSSGSGEEFCVVIPHVTTTSPRDQQVRFVYVETKPLPERGNRVEPVPGVFGMTEDDERDKLFPMLGGSLASSIAAMRSTCRLASRQYSDATLKPLINAELRTKGIDDIIDYDLPSTGLLLRFLYVIRNSGEWEGWKPICRVAYHQGRFDGPKMVLRRGDVEGVGSRGLFDGRCMALRQLSLICRRLNSRGQRSMILDHTSDGHELLGGERLSLPVPSRSWASFDRNNPVCEYMGGYYASLRGAVLSMCRNKTRHEVGPCCVASRLQVR